MYGGNNVCACTGVSSGQIYRRTHIHTYILYCIPPAFAVNQNLKYIKTSFTSMLLIKYFQIFIKTYIFNFLFQYCDLVVFSFLKIIPFPNLLKPNSFPVDFYT